MTPQLSLGQAFGEGLHREKGLCDERKHWTAKDWWERKLFLEDLIELETERSELASLQGRLMAVCVEGHCRFGTS